MSFLNKILITIYAIITVILPFQEGSDCNCNYALNVKTSIKGVHKQFNFFLLSSCHRVICSIFLFHPFYLKCELLVIIFLDCVGLQPTMRLATIQKIPFLERKFHQDSETIMVSIKAPISDFQLKSNIRLVSENPIKLIFFSPKIY